MIRVIKHLYHTFLGDSQNYQPLSAVDHLMNYRPHSSTSGDSSLGGRQHLGAYSFDYRPERYKIVVYFLFFSFFICSILQILPVEQNDRDKLPFLSVVTYT